MRNFKKVVAAGLALLMLALSVNVSFAAENYTEKEAVVVAKVNAAGIMTGTDKGFEPSKTLTRAEAAAIMVRMKGISEDTVKQNAGTTLFTDVPASHWAAGYINVASNYNLIKGVGANKFAPEKEVTVAEFYTMAIRALGAGQLVEAEGSWPTNYVNFAIENEIAEDVAQIYSAASTRMTAATIIVNTLTANMWVKDSVRTNGEITWKEDSTKSILDSILHISEFEKISITNVKTKDRKADFTDGLEEAKTLFTKEGCEVGENANLASVKLGQKYTIWYDRDDKEVVGFWIPEEAGQINFTEIKEIKDKKIKLVVDGEEKKYDLVDAPHYYLNGTGSTANGVTGTTLPAFGIALTKDGDVEYVYAESYENAGIVKEIKNDKIYFEYEDIKGVTGLFKSATLPLKLDEKADEVYKVTKDGKEIAIAVERNQGYTAVRHCKIHDNSNGIRSRKKSRIYVDDGDALYWYVNDKEYTMEVVNDTVDGKVVASTDKKIEIDGEEYDLYADKLATVKDEGTFYLYNNKVTMWHKDKEDKGNFAIISADRVINGTKKDSYDYQVKLLSLDGTLGDWTTVDIKETNKKFAGVEGFVAFEDDDASAQDPKTAAEKIDAVYAAKDIVTYTMKSGKVVFTPDVDKKAFTDYTDATKDFITTADGKYFITSSTVIVELEKDDDEYVLNVLDADDIDTIPTGTLGNAADFDKNEVGIVVFDENKSQVKTDSKWAYIKDAVKCTRDDNEDIEWKLTVVYAGEAKETKLYAKSSITNVTVAEGKTLKDSIVGNVYNLAVSDDIVTKVTKKDLYEKSEMSEAKTKNATLLYKDYGEDMKNFAATTYTDPAGQTPGRLNVAESSYYVVSDDVIVIELTFKDDNSVDKRNIKDLSDIDELTQEDGDDTKLDEEVDTIKNVWFEKVDDEYVVVAITYLDNEKASN